MNAKLIAPLNDMAEQWLTNAGLTAEKFGPHKRLMKRFVAWAFIAPIISLCILWTLVTPVSALAYALITTGLFMLAAGLLMQTASIRIASGFIQICAAMSIMALVSWSSSTIPYFAGLFGLLFFEAQVIVRGRRAVLFTMACAISGVLLYWMLSTFLIVNTGQISETGELSQILMMAMILVAYGAFRLFNASLVGKALADEAKSSNNLAAQADLTQNQLEPHELLMSLPGMLTTHSVDGQVTQISGTQQNLISQRCNNILGQGFLNNIYVADRISYLSAIDRLRVGETGHEVVFRIENTQKEQLDCQFKFLKSTFIGAYNANNELEKFYIQSFDCTNQIQQHQELDELKARAAESDVAKTKFLAGVSHELRTPLNSIMGFSDVLIHDVIAPLPDERLREYVQNIRHSGEHLLNVVNTMLDMSKIQNGHYELYKEEFVMQELLDRAKKILQIQADTKNITFTCRSPQGLPEFTADTRALMQIIINVVGNAIKFTDDGGIVTLDCFLDETDLVLKISDTGIGIPEDKLSVIGQPFMQVNSTLARQYEGTGLGLSLVKGLLELHEGSFNIESKLGQGTIVELKIPQQDPKDITSLTEADQVASETKNSNDTENVKNVA